MRSLPKTLPAPERPTHLSPQIKWLAGEGAGSWFLLDKTDNNLVFKITRYSPSGKKECDGTFLAAHSINCNQDFSFDYPSHCLKVTILQNNKRIRLKAI